MKKQQKAAPQVFGNAARIRLRTLVGSKLAWDCRRYGLGIVIAPRRNFAVDLAPGVQLELDSGRLIATQAPRGSRPLRKAGA